MAKRAAGRWAGASGLMALPLAIAMSLIIILLQSNSSREVSLAARVAKSEHKMVLRAQQAAKARYQKMMAAALQAEARAHKEGEVATAKAMSYQQSLEKRMLFARRRRDMM
ncbi:hypothetical protein GUITHDRAFT_142611 [Guillardia theta CCMP2712]|uniref:Uncharacterized protein n=1 Tax=Guillardia theta (strain CCMP2712) TaxID=905079 RepID=L1IY48_GUITC|nr:hypothetical protein GUITHDRAFT_142611 [Guillardia theta CCMP2712]EKX40750.1 hypothetical protein GUITHDRAFT_142611 [Guillardia theta CCMP2712]|eukprot:XP_005827730.1 hypothetical protein GUITHDRAFT_142611 [Guillardia theta CCMP2712]